MHMRKRKGFTLIELIVVIAIIGVLSAILVPALIGYINKAKKKSTVANAKTIYTSIMNILATSDEAYKSFFNTDFAPHGRKGRQWLFESTPDGICTRWDTGLTPNVDGNYILSVITRVDGCAHAIGSGVNDNPPDSTLNTWNDTDPNNSHRFFLEALGNSLDLQSFQQNGETFPVKMPYTGREDGKKQPLVRWIVCIRPGSAEKVEIWAGDGTKAKNGPAYRVYPDPAPNYF